MKFGCAICIFLNYEDLICLSTDISKCFRGSLKLRVTRVDCNFNVYKNTCLSNFKWKCICICLNYHRLNYLNIQRSYLINPPSTYLRKAAYSLLCVFFFSSSLGTGALSGRRSMLYRLWMSGPRSNPRSVNTIVVF